MQNQLSLGSGAPAISAADPLVRSTSRGLAGSWMDLVQGLLHWRLWSTLGWNDILQRYRRSVLGPFWLTASMGIFVIALGLLYSELFQQSVADFIPFFCVGILVWNLIASYLT